MTISRLICGLLKGNQSVFHWTSTQIHIDQQKAITLTPLSAQNTVPAGANANAAKAPATAGAFATFHCSAVARDAGDAQWRRKRELPASKTSFGPLTNLPDYTFNDGRPTPLGVSFIIILRDQFQSIHKLTPAIYRLCV